MRRIVVRKFLHAKLRRLAQRTEILRQKVEFELQVKEVKIFYAILSMLQSRCSNSNGERLLSQDIRLKRRTPRLTYDFK